MLRIALQAGQQPVTNFIHHDYLGSTVLTTDTNSQPTSNSLSYFPYGNSLNNETIEQLNNLSYLFTNQELDPEVDLYNYNARLYNPKTGVFISVDTVGGGNRYAYANNNPMMFVDPSGHDAWYQDPRMSQGGLNLVDLYTLGGAQWSSYGAMMTSFPYEWYEANLPYWNGEFGTVPGTDQPYTPTSIAEQFVLGKLRPELQDQITNQVVQSVGIDAYQSAAALGGLAMVGGLKINDLHSRTSRILDLAVGEGGSYIRDVPEGTTYIGTDINIEALQVLKEKYPNALVVVADAENLPFDSASFDKIVSYWPKGTLAEQGLSGSTEGWFGEFSRVLKSEGVLEITAPSTSISVFGNGSRGLAPGYINYFELSSANQLRANDLIKINTYWSNRTLEGLISRAPSGDINPFSKVWASTFVKVP
jgi:RHS repeat-associated protein